jgi:hypothetical protein
MAGNWWDNYPHAGGSQPGIMNLPPSPQQQAEDARNRSADQRAAAAEARAQQEAADRHSLFVATHNPDGSPKPEPNVTQYSQAALDAFDRGISSIDRLKTHPGFGAMVGSGFDPQSCTQIKPWSGEPWGGTDAAGFKAQLSSLKAQTFLPMVQALKGMGQLSNIEGEKLTDSIGALDPNMSEAEFLGSINRVQQDLTHYRNRAVGGMPQTHTAPTRVGERNQLGTLQDWMRGMPRSGPARPPANAPRKQPAQGGNIIRYDRNGRRIP